VTRDNRTEELKKCLNRRTWASSASEGEDLGEGDSGVLGRQPLSRITGAWSVDAPGIQKAVPDR